MLNNKDFESEIISEIIIAPSSIVRTRGWVGEPTPTPSYSNGLNPPTGSKIGIL